MAHLRDRQRGNTQQPNDVTYEEVPGPSRYNDPCQPILLSVHKSGNERSKRRVKNIRRKLLKRNEAYGVRGEVQVAAINGTTDAVCYSVIDSLVSNLEKQPVELKFKWRNNYSTSVI